MDTFLYCRKSTQVCCSRSMQIDAGNFGGMLSSGTSSIWFLQLFCCALLLFALLGALQQPQVVWDWSCENNFVWVCITCPRGIAGRWAHENLNVAGLFGSPFCVLGCNYLGSYSRCQWCCRCSLWWKYLQSQLQCTYFDLCCRFSTSNLFHPPVFNKRAAFVVCACQNVVPWMGNHS